MKEHHFLIEDAERYGVGEAILLYNIRYWLIKNLANDKNKHDGRVWTYNSYSAFAKLFPYYTPRQIRTRLEKLEKEGVIITGAYNKKGIDKTKWYSINEDKFTCENVSNYKNVASSDKNVTWTDQKVYPDDQSVKPIPDSKPDSKPDNPPIIPQNDFQDFFSQYCSSSGKPQTKKNRIASEREFAKLNKNEIELAVAKVQDFVKFRIEQQERQFGKHEPKYIPNPQTYLKDALWEEAPERIPLIRESGHGAHGHWIRHRYKKDRKPCPIDTQDVKYDRELDEYYILR